MDEDKVKAISDRIKNFIMCMTMVMSKGSKVDEGSGNKLCICVRGFEMAIRNLEDANKAVEDKEDDARSCLSAVSPSYEQCRTVLEEDKRWVRLVF